MFKKTNKEDKGKFEEFLSLCKERELWKSGDVVVAVRTESLKLHFYSSGWVFVYGNGDDVVSLGNKFTVEEMGILYDLLVRKEK